MPVPLSPRVRPLPPFVVGADAVAYLPLFNDVYTGCRSKMLRHVQTRQELLSNFSGDSEFVSGALSRLGVKPTP